MAYEIPILEKQPSESLLYDMDFVGRMEDDVTLTAVVSVTGAPTGLTIGSASYSGTRAQFRISGGTAGTKYKLTVVVTTSDGNTLEGEGNLFVMNT